MNRLEWVLGEYACYTQSMVACPLYDTLGDEAIEHIINQTEMKVILLTSDKAKYLVEASEKMPTLKTLVFMDTVPSDIKEQAAAKNLECFLITDVEKEGEENPKEMVLQKQTDLCCICYTSGTTGLPKGVMLTHRNILAASGSNKFLGENGLGPQVGPSDVHISYLPLAHIFERAVQAFLLSTGAKIGFYRGDTLKLLEDLGELKPTFFPSVPRLLNRVYDKVLANIASQSAVVKTLFNWAMSSKKGYLKEGYLTHSVWDALVFKKTKDRLGGRVKYMVTGAAPISADVLTFLRVAFCCEVYEGYGQTENGACATITNRGDFSTGHVGSPQPAVEIKLVDVPEMNYTSNDKPFPRGEICVRGAAVTSGYYKMPEKSKEDIDEDGWLHSGDIGVWDERGRLKIIDRKKNIFKLAQGEYIAPEKVEIVYGMSKYVAQAFVYGDSLKAALVGIIVPDEEVLMEYCKDKKIEGDFKSVCQKDEIIKLVFSDIVSVGKANGLKGFEQVKAISLSSAMFSVENDLLTPTFKLKRPQAKNFFEEQITALYAKIEA